MVSFWVPFTLGIIAALIALGVVSINLALERSTKLDFAGIESVDEETNMAMGRLTAPFDIQFLDEGFTSIDIVHRLQIKQGDSATVFVELTSYSELPIQMYATYGQGISAPVLPEGVKITLQETNMVLKPQVTKRIPIFVNIDKEAPDGWYMIKVYARWSEDLFKGTGFHLIVGKGSNELMKPH